MSKIDVYELKGLKPDALATYLMALGVMRLLAEQKDANIRGFWHEEHFVLVSELDWEAIEHFFLQEYAPTPILAPWNMESGFFSLKLTDATSGGADEERTREGEIDAHGGPPDDDEQASEEDDATERAARDPLLAKFGDSKAKRFESFKHAIETAWKAIPSDLRSADEAVRVAHEKFTAEVKKRTAEHRARLEDTRTQQAHKTGQEHEKTLINKAKVVKKEHKEAEEEVKKDRQLKKLVEDAKGRFKEIQGETKSRLIAKLRSGWGEKGQQWVDAAIALDEKGEAGFTSLFGSGGNDGRMEFTKNFRQHLVELFDPATGTAKEGAKERLGAALKGIATNRLVNKAVGQFFPGRAGGSNMGAGFDGSAGVNPWEFVLMLEGAVALVAGLSRRGDVERARVSSPFWVEGASAGFGSAAQREDSPRGEQWLPLWSQPMRYNELVELIREGRAQVGRRQATRAADLVRATARLGLARGMDALQRFAYLQRNGQSNLAVSTGRFRVASRSHQVLLEEVAPWIDRLVGHARDKNAPMSLGVIARRAEEALFTVCRQEAAATLWRELLVTLGDAELVLLRAGKNPRRAPLPRLSSGWLAAVDDRTAEGRTALRLALALASQHSPRERENASLVDSVRRHFLPLVDWHKRRPRFKLDAKSGRVLPDPEHVCFGRSLIADAIALVERRSLWARSSNEDRERTPRLPLEAARGCEVTPEEIGAWFRGEVDDDAVLGLVRPLLALRWDELDASEVPRPLLGGVPEPLHLLFRLAHLPFDVPVQGSDGRTEADVTVRFDPEPLRRLAAGDLDSALKVTIRRLEASGLRPVFRRGVATPVLARRLAASLAFPISRGDAARAVRLVCKPCDVKDTEESSVTPA